MQNHQNEEDVWSAKNADKVICLVDKPKYRLILRYLGP